jgi:signal transduction histidine kinase/ligand-binding sensor domain-containing protein
MAALKRIKISALIAATLALVSATHAAQAKDSSKPADSYLRTRFSSAEGFTNVVDEIVQSNDGFLWMRVNFSYLVRFDGRHFKSFLQPRGVLSLALAPNGDLWLGTDRDLQQIPASGLNQFEPLPAISYRPIPGKDIRISCLRFSRSGVLWVGTSNGLYRFERGVFTHVISGMGITRMREASNGHMFVITSNGFIEWDGAREVPQPELAAQLDVKPDKIFDVLEDRQGVFWFCTGKGVARRIGETIEKLGKYDEANEAGSAYEDSNGNIWFLTPHGVFRATSAGLEVVVAGTQPRVLYSDRDGNLWIGTNGDGLYRFRDRATRMFTTADGLPNNVIQTVLASRDGGIWTGANCGGVSRYDGHSFRTYGMKDGLLNDCVWALTEDANGDLLIGTWGGGAFRFHDGKFTQYSKPQGLSSDIVTSIAAARDGSIWIATRKGLSRIRDGQIRNYTKADGLSFNGVFRVLEDRTGVIWAGTPHGIDRLVGDRFVSFSSLPNALVFPIGEDRSGGLYASQDEEGGIFRIENDRSTLVAPGIGPPNMLEVGENLWFTGSEILRIPVSDLRRSHAADDPFDFGRFGSADGLASPEASAGAPNAALTRDSKLWVATTQGLAVMDLARLPKTDRMPAIYLEEITVGRNKQFPGHQLSLAAGTHHTELLFDAVEIASPEKIRLQYRLDGVDSEWLDAGESGHAIYSNIPAGTHAFHIRACNRDGVWDRTGIVYFITQQPYFYQTRWFLVAAVVLGLSLLLGFFRLHLNRATARLNAGLEERLAERTRVARELHDTFLQTVQGSKMVADHALKNSDDHARLVQAVESLSTWLGQAAQEGRSALNALHSSTTEMNDLAEALKRATEESRMQTPMEVSLSVVGEVKEMHPIVRDEVYRIGYEAVRNACVHSGGTRLEVGLIYANDLTLRVSDNGEGIDPDIVASGKEGHFGIQSMRERAERIGGKLTVVSSAGSGTEITLVVPGRTIFRKPKPSRIDKLRSFLDAR